MHSLSPPILHRDLKVSIQFIFGSIIQLRLQCRLKTSCKLIVKLSKYVILDQQRGVDLGINLGIYMK